MEILNNIEWYFDNPKNAVLRDTRKKITKQQLSTIVFTKLDNVENIKFCFPLNDDFTYTQTRELATPATVEQILTLIHKFYSEPLTKETIDKSFGETIEGIERKHDWQDNAIDCSHKLTNIDIFDDTCAPDFCGINLIETGENAGEYFVGVGPE